MDEQPKIRVLVACNVPLHRTALHGLLEELPCVIAGTATNGQQTLQMTQSLRPDVVLLDFPGPGIDPLAISRLILERCPTPVVALVEGAPPQWVAAARAAGVGAHLISPSTASTLERAIDIALARFDDILTLQRKTAEIEALHKAGLRLTSSLELQPVLDAFLEQVLSLVDADDAHIFCYDGEQITVGAALWADGTRGQPFSWPRPGGLTYTVAQRGERIVIPDVDRHSLFEDWHWGGAIVGIPLRFGDQIVGVMNVAYLQPRPFEENHLRLLELLAAQAAIAIHNANLFEQVQRHADELEGRVAQRTRALTEANDRLQELDRLKTKFIGDISHALRTPATNVRLYLELLERGKLEKRDHYLAVIEEQTDRIVRLVEDILYFSQLELDHSKLQLEPVDLNLIAEQAVTAHGWHAETAGLALIFEPDRALPPVRAGAEQLAQAIKNLVDNAINYTAAGEVRVTTHWDEEHGQARLQVTDTGRGIDAQDLPHLFERFYRGQEVGGSNIAGSGLGLSIAQEIVHLHGGSIQVQSQVGAGSLFTVVLPVEGG